MHLSSQLDRRSGSSGPGRADIRLLLPAIPDTRVNAIKKKKKTVATLSPLLPFLQSDSFQGSYHLNHFHHVVRSNVFPRSDSNRLLTSAGFRICSGRWNIDVSMTSSGGGGVIASSLRRWSFGLCPPSGSGQEQALIHAD
jgi:hypothetical protein